MPTVRAVGGERNRAVAELDSGRNKIRNRTSPVGFTLLELMVVMSIIAILMSIAIPMYNRSILRTREKALRSDLEMLNRQIVQYTLDKQKAPQGLGDLKTAGYLERIPDDPMTKEPNWEVENDDVIFALEQQDPGITGVHSASSAISSNGTAYSSW